MISEQLLGYADDALPIGSNQADPGAPVDGQRTLVGDGVLGFRTRHVDPVSHRIGGALAGKDVLTRPPVQVDRARTDTSRRDNSSMVTRR